MRTRPCFSQVLRRQPCGALGENGLRPPACLPTLSVQSLDQSAQDWVFYFVKCIHLLFISFLCVGAQAVSEVITHTFKTATQLNGVHLSSLFLLLVLKPRRPRWERGISNAKNLRLKEDGWLREREGGREVERERENVNKRCRKRKSEGTNRRASNTAREQVRERETMKEGRYGRGVSDRQ